MSIVINGDSMRAAYAAAWDREMQKTPAEVEADRAESKRLAKKVTISTWQLEQYERAERELSVWRVWGRPPAYNRHGELLNDPLVDASKLCHVASGGGDVCGCGKR